MEYELEIYKNPTYASVIGHGKAYAKDFTEIVEELFAHEEFEEGIAFYHDYRELSVGDLSIKEVKSIANMVISHKSKFGKGKWALLVRDDLNFGMGRMWEVFVTYGADIDVKIFRNEDEAINWVTARKPGA